MDLTTINFKFYQHLHFIKETFHTQKEKHGRKGEREGRMEEGRKGIVSK